MFHVHLRKTSIILLWSDISLKYLLNPSVLMCHLRQLFLYFLSGWPILWCHWSAKVPYAYCSIVGLSVYVSQYWLYIFTCSTYIGFINVYKSYVLMLEWPLYHYKMPFCLLLQHVFWSLFCLVLNSILSGLSIATPGYFFAIYMKCLFHPFTSSLVFQIADSIFCFILSTVDSNLVFIPVIVFFISDSSLLWFLYLCWKFSLTSSNFPVIWVSL